MFVCVVLLLLVASDCIITRMIRWQSEQEIQNQTERCSGGSERVERRFVSRVCLVTFSHVEAAMNCGGDSDTVGAIVGALAGGTVGASIPRNGLTASSNCRGPSGCCEKWWCSAWTNSKREQPGCRARAAMESTTGDVWHATPHFDAGRCPRTQGLSGRVFERPIRLFHWSKRSN